MELNQSSIEEDAIMDEKAAVGRDDAGQDDLELRDEDAENVTGGLSAARSAELGPDLSALKNPTHLEAAEN